MSVSTQALSIVDQIDEILECSICSNIFNDPKILPCVHTFCSLCLQQYCDSRKVGCGGSAPCPLCRKQFTLSSDGADAMPRNHFVGMLKDLRDSFQQRFCHFHNEKQLEIYCLDCGLVICVSCYFSDHRSHRCTDNIAAGQTDEGKASSSCNYLDCVSFHFPDYSSHQCTNNIATGQTDEGKASSSVFIRKILFSPGKIQQFV
jgi:Zinc finger, C3HC4 type (RING finger)/B-box zinc finger